MTANPSRLQCVLDIRASLGEGPVWSTREQVLYWVDINAPSLNRFDPATGRNVAYPMPASIGCLALRLNKVEDPAAAAIVVETMNRIMLTIPLPKADAELVTFDTFRKRQAERV